MTLVGMLSPGTPRFLGPLRAVTRPGGRGCVWVWVVWVWVAAVTAPAQERPPWALGGHFRESSPHQGDRALEVSRPLEAPCLRLGLLGSDHVRGDRPGQPEGRQHDHGARERAQGSCLCGAGGRLTPTPFPPLWWGRPGAMLNHGLHLLSLAQASCTRVTCTPPLHTAHAGSHGPPAHVPTRLLFLVTWGHQL